MTQEEGWQEVRTAAMKEFYADLRNRGTTELEREVPKVESYYLVETSIDGDPHELRSYKADALTDFLRQNIEVEHYAWVSYEVHGIYRYDSPGRLTELQLTCVKADETDEDDYMHSAWQVWEPGGGGERKIEVEFSVTLDGRV
jgi:hypothetical protein